MSLAVGSKFNTTRLTMPGSVPMGTLSASGTARTCRARSPRHQAICSHVPSKAHPQTHTREYVVEPGSSHAISSGSLPAPPSKKSSSGSGGSGSVGRVNVEGLVTRAPTSSAERAAPASAAALPTVSPAAEEAPPLLGVRWEKDKERN